MTVEMAQELTGNKTAASILSVLIDMNYFIHSHFSDQVYYQYHPLFRDFLLTRLKIDLPAKDLAAIERKAAGILAVNGWIDDAIRSYQYFSDWGPLVSLLLKEAPVMLSQGRHQTLREWLDSVPEHIIEENAWLSYWKGRCPLAFDSNKTRGCFGRGYEAFYNKKDPPGTFLSWCGIVEAAIHGFDDLK